jgi:hypothetical protein
MNSIARFEAFIRDMESGDVKPPEHSFMMKDHPKRIPSPTQRALEYVSTGLMRSSSDSSDYGDTEDDNQQPSASIPDYVLNKKSASLPDEKFGLSRQASEASLGTTASMAGSISGLSHVESQSLGVSNGKRHSMADFSVMRISTPPLFQIAASRRGSHSEVPRNSESYDDGPSPLGGGRDFSNHPRVTRTLFEGFSF